MSPTPTGSRRQDGTDSYLVLAREFATDVQDAWNAVTDSSRTEQWFGPWHGDPASGVITVQMMAEEGHPEMESRVLQCDAPRKLVLETGEAAGGWHLELDVVDHPSGGVTVELSHRLSDPELASQAGPGWEFYLDRLVAAETGGDPAAVAFTDYYPSQAQYYRELFTD
ncbi:SRPBCC domain-containing protein [Kocuria sp.]|uniref:SRPBCC domain-containing protein n=1 Tax=Kocuria sp. TaxID=1871328 RepID=UPI0026DF9360|nr:SRPBCC domain-containing protein [Kocuria sp.]